jgi:hypothetical protein
MVMLPIWAWDDQGVQEPSTHVESQRSLIARQSCSLHLRRIVQERLLERLDPSFYRIAVWSVKEKTNTDGCTGGGLASSKARCRAPLQAYRA